MQLDNKQMRSGRERKEGGGVRDAEKSQHQEQGRLVVVHLPSPKQSTYAHEPLNN